MSIEVIINGEASTHEQGVSLEALLQSLELTKGRIAVELNGEIIPRSQFATQQIKDQDKLEIVQAIGGG